MAKNKKFEYNSREQDINYSDTLLFRCSLYYVHLPENLEYTTSSKRPTSNTIHVSLFRL